MGSLLKFNEKIRKVEEFILGTGIIIMASLLIANVIARMVFNKSINFAEELSSLLTIAVTFVGVSYCARVGRHIMMSALFDAIALKGKRMFLFISSTVTFLAMVYLTNLSFQYAMKVFASGRYTPALQIPMWIPYMIVPLGFFLAAIQYVLIFYMNIRDKGEAHICITPLHDERTNVDDITPDAEAIGGAAGAVSESGPAEGNLKEPTDDNGPNSDKEKKPDGEGQKGEEN